LAGTSGMLRRTLAPVGKIIGFMKKTMVIVLLLIAIAIYFRVKYVDRQARNENFQKQIGVYKLDVYKTDLGVYRKDSSIYKELILTFKEDGTFSFNMKVPFINDSIGKWKASGSSIDEWNNLYFNSWDYGKGNSGEQFTQCCDVDTTFYINSATPQIGEKGIQEIYFKKLNSKASDFDNYTSPAILSVHLPQALLSCVCHSGASVPPWRITFVY
jgi:hypothetical protein